MYTSSPFDDESFNYDKEFPELDRIYDIFNERVPGFEMEVFLKEKKQ